MHNVEISGNIYDEKISVMSSFPSDWLEWDRSHLLHYCRVQNMPCPLEKKKQALSFLFLGIERSLYLNLDLAYRLQIAELTSDFFTDNWLNKNLIPHFVFKKQVYHGPKDGFENITFLEWILCDQFFTKFQRTEDPFALDCLFAVMWRRQKSRIEIDSTDFDGDFRSTLNKSMIEEQAKVFSGLDQELKTALLTIYIGNRNTVTNRFKRVFENGSSDSETDKYGWTGVLVQLAGTKFGNKEQTEQTMLYDMLIHFHQNIVRLDEWEEKNK